MSLNWVRKRLAILNDSYLGVERSETSSKETQGNLYQSKRVASKEWNILIKSGIDFNKLEQASKSLTSTEEALKSVESYKSLKDSCLLLDVRKSLNKSINKFGKNWTSRERVLLRCLRIPIKFER